MATNPKTNTTVALVLSVAILTLGACTTEPDAPATSDPAPPASDPTPAPAPSATVAPIGEEAVLAIDTVATAPDGAMLELALRGTVRSRPTTRRYPSWDRFSSIRVARTSSPQPHSIPRPGGWCGSM